jgi:hypothetical protein
MPATMGLPFALFLVGLFGGGKTDLTTRAKPVRRTTVTPVRTTRTRPAARPAARPTARPATTPAPAPAPSPPKVVPVSRTTAVQVQPAPWPQVVPSGLPAFPGPRWVPDNPPGPGVVARAQQLLPSLWRHGAGTFKSEQTGGRWITYRATPMGSKKGVVAFKLLPGEETKMMVPPPSTPDYAPVQAEPPSRFVPASVTKPKPSPVALPTLRLTSPRTTGESVKVLQRKLGITADGVFGTGTYRSVIAYQKSRGLTPDGIVGRQTWGALFSG